jgi:hypothetical protein
LNYVPEQPPARPQLSQAQSETQQQYEDELQAEFGINAVYCFRTMIAEAKESGKYKSYVPLFPSFEKLRSLLRELKRRGLWKDGRLQAKPGTTPQEAFERSNKKRDKRRRKKMEREGLFGDPDVPHSGDAGKFFAGIRASLDQTSADPIDLSQPVGLDTDWEESIRAEGPLYEEVEDDDTDPSLLMPPTGDPADVQMEQRLMSQIRDLERRDIACYCYRNLRAKSGLTPKVAYEAVMRNIGSVPPLEAPSFDGNKTYSGRLHHDASGRTVASPELMERLNPHRILDWCNRNSLDRLGYRPGEQRHQKGYEFNLLFVSMIAYIIGAEPIGDPPVRRIKVWIYDSDGVNSLFYVLGDRWYGWKICGLPGFDEMWYTVMNAFLPNRPDLRDEVEHLKNYRIEVHSDRDAPPGLEHESGKVNWGRVLFGGAKSVPASPEDMRGAP